MNHETLCKLKDGDIIRNTSGNAFVVLRNTGQCVIATRTLEIHNGAEWELVYTTRPVKSDAAPSLVDAISDLQNLGWSFNDVTDRWISPDGNFATRILRHAWEVRNKYAKPLPSLTVKGPRSLPSRMDMWRQLKDAGWIQVSPNVWKAHRGQALRGGIEWAWRRMDNARIDAATAAGARPPVKSFAEARAALVAAGWKNICGKVWRSPKGSLIDGTKAAYDAMNGGAGGNPS